MTLETLCREALSRFQKVKVAKCEQRTGPANLLVMVEATFRLNSKSQVMMLSGDPRESLPTALEQLLSLGSPEMVVLLADGYARPEGLPANYHLGQLAEDFKNNPLTSVREILTVEGINTLTGSQHQIVVPYAYGDDGLPYFGSYLSSNTEAGVYFGEILGRWFSAMPTHRRRRRR